VLRSDVLSNWLTERGAINGAGHLKSHRGADHLGSDIVAFVQWVEPSVGQRVQCYFIWGGLLRLCDRLLEPVRRHVLRGDVLANGVANLEPDQLGPHNVADQLGPYSLAVDLADNLRPDCQPHRQPHRQPNREPHRETQRKPVEDADHH